MKNEDSLLVFRKTFGKNEDRILELLMDYINRTEKMEKVFTEEITQLRKDFNQSNARQEELMKEIFRISKRVSDIEDRLP